MQRFLTLLVLGLAVTATLAEAKAKHIRVTAEIVQQDFTGDINNPQLGDQLLSSVVLRNEHGDDVGTGTGACAMVSVAPLAPRLQCLISAVLANGQIVFGGSAPLPAVGVRAVLGILGGTEDFSKARGEATLTVLSPTLQDAVFELE
jgi:hypothetical protein